LISLLHMMSSHSNAPPRAPTPSPVDRERINFDAHADDPLWASLSVS